MHAGGESVRKWECCRGDPDPGSRTRLAPSARPRPVAPELPSAPGDCTVCSAAARPATPSRAAGNDGSGLAARESSRDSGHALASFSARDRSLPVSRNQDTAAAATPNPAPGNRSRQAAKSGGINTIIRARRPRRGSRLRMARLQDLRTFLSNPLKENYFPSPDRLSGYLAG